MTRRRLTRIVRLMVAAVMCAAMFVVASYSTFEAPPQTPWPAHQAATR